MNSPSDGNQPGPTAGEAPGGAGDATVRLEAVVTEKPGDRIGRYKLLQVIGEGGCGVVYMAEQEEPVRRRVALKVIKPGMDSKQVLARFEAERQALALMDHPNIAKVLDAGATVNGRPYFVMELVRGVKFTEFCDQKRSPASERLALFIQVCKAIQHAHQKGIIHRDIKPSNILVTLHDGVPMPKVIDFGIAKAMDQRLTNLTLFTAYEQFIGTPAYMSPEQAEMSGLDIDTRSDIYSLGVMLYELLTGQTPFDTETLTKKGIDEIRRVIREVDPPRPSTRLSTMLAGQLELTAQRRQCDAPKLIHLLRGDLDWIVMKCLEKDRSRRYETANGLAADLQRYLNHEAVVARPPSTLYRLQKSVQRNRLAFAAAGAVAVALVAGLVTSTWLFLREKQARERAVAAERAETELRKSEAELRQKAEVNEQKAIKEAAKSRQVAQFLEDMLDGIGPSVALGRDTVLLREILDKTAERAGTQLKDQPEVEAELAHTVGGVYWTLGDYQKAETILRRVLELRRRTSGNDHPDVAAAMNDVGVVLEFQGRLPEAEAIQRDVLALRIKLRGAEHDDVAESLLNLGNVLWKEGKLAEAEKADRDALAMYRKILGQDHPQTEKALNNLGTVLRDEGKLSEAEDAQRQTLALRRKRFNNFSPDVAYSINNLAIVLQDEGKLADAETLFRESLVMFRKLLGNEHPDIATSLNNLAAVLQLENKLPEAESLNRESLTLRLKAFGEDHSATAVSMDILARLLRDVGKLDEAERFARQCLAIREKKLPDDWRYFSAQCLVGSILLEKKDSSKAEPLLLTGYQGLKQRAERIPANSKPRVSEAIESLIKVCEAGNRPEEATRWRQALALEKSAR